MPLGPGGALSWRGAPRDSHIADIQAEIDAHNDIFKSVDGNRPKMVKALGTSEEAIFLQQRLDDMNQRWSDLKTKSANIRVHLEASAERWSRLLALLEELWRWLGLKEEELDKQKPIGGDIPSLLQQQNHCTDIQAEIDAHNDIFKSVDGNRPKMVKALGTSEEAIFLQQRLDDMNQRWSDLKTKSANIRVHLEASAERWSRLLALLEELWRWLGLKEEELDKQKPIGGDIPTLLQQQNHCTALRTELKTREPMVVSTLDQACMFLADQPIEGPEEPRRNLQPKTELTPEEKAQRVAKAIRKQTAEVGERWERLSAHAGSWQQQVDRALEKLQDLRGAMGQLDLRLAELEDTKAGWQPVGDLLIDSLQGHIEKTTAFKEEIAPLKQDVRVANELSSQLTPLDVQLSSGMSRQLDDLNMRWKLLQVAVEERLKQLQEAHRDFGPSSQHFLSTSVQQPWQRAVSQNKVPYYINHQTQTTCWDHPKMTELFQSMVLPPPVSTIPPDLGVHIIIRIYWIYPDLRKQSRVSPCGGRSRPPAARAGITAISRGSGFTVPRSV
ncbi:hypothetical protein SKAU_G00185170 [Synaphobranchus kaupii]|uniref:WW domain-containing protein n=1 Tax=Synaphobranchus kaupii TaxID=118154 RepID=A0A9Q1FCY0_SYNKA|nr:hypothetical protein SKAU_G00185170 [Synaphobranchus kaupii]